MSSVLIALLLALVLTATDASPSWKLVFEDTFSQLNSSIWSSEADCWGGGNNENQCYTSRQENVRVDNGHLVLEARREPFKGNLSQCTLSRADMTPSEIETYCTQQQPFTSGRIVSKHTGNTTGASWKYGRFDVVAQLPAGQGVWAAIWMLPANHTYGPWPGSGEIDIMESWTKKDEPSEMSHISGALHYGKPWPEQTSAEGPRSGFSCVDDFSDGFHNFSIAWTPTSVTWYMDGVQHYYVNLNRTMEPMYSSTGEPFNQDFYLIMNLAVGGDKPKVQPNDITLTKPQLLVDSVRVYQMEVYPDELEAPDSQGCTALEGPINTTISIEMSCGMDDWVAPAQVVVAIQQESEIITATMERVGTSTTFVVTLMSSTESLAPYKIQVLVTTLTHPDKFLAEPLNEAITDECSLVDSLGWRTVPRGKAYHGLYGSRCSSVCSSDVLQTSVAVDMGCAAQKIRSYDDDEDGFWRVALTVTHKAMHIGTTEMDLTRKGLSNSSVYSGTLLCTQGVSCPERFELAFFTDEGQVGQFERLEGTRTGDACSESEILAGTWYDGVYQLSDAFYHRTIVPGTKLHTTFGACQPGCSSLHREPHVTAWGITLLVTLVIFIVVIVFGVLTPLVSWCLRGGTDKNSMLHLMSSPKPAAPKIAI